MADAERDQNRVTTLLGVSSENELIPIKLQVDPVTGRLLTTATIPAQFVPDADYDYIDVQQTSATVETIVYKKGGSGGTTERTIVVTYTDSNKTDIDTVVYS